MFSVSLEIVSPKKLHDLSKAPRQGARSEEITCPVYNPVSHTGDSHTTHFVSRNNLTAFQHRACPCCQAPCAISNYDVASISTLFSPGETGDLATAVLCCLCPPAGVLGMLAKGRHSKTAACDSFVCVQPSQGALALCLVEDILPQMQQALPVYRGETDMGSAFQCLLPALSFPLGEENVSLKQELKQ